MSTKSQFTKLYIYTYKQSACNINIFNTYLIHEKYLYLYENTLLKLTIEEAQFFNCIEEAFNSIEKQTLIIIKYFVTQFIHYLLPSGPFCK